MNKPKSVLYFEDTDETANAVLAVLTPLLNGIATVERFVATEQTEEMFDARLEAEIATRQAASDVIFILSDGDLATTNMFKGLSDSNVYNVASKLGIPSAYYSNNLTGVAFLKAELAGHGRIFLDKTEIEQMCGDVARLVKGFIAITELLEALSNVDNSEKPHDTASLLGVLLGRKEMKNRIKLYVSGDQKLGSELLASDDRTALRKAAILGTVIYESLLKYPGLTVNATAAASYLNISEEEFCDQEIRALFELAKYEGPFASDDKPMWWRDELDEILIEEADDEEFEDGRSLVKQKINKDVAPCRCVEGDHDSAGYYCILTKKPVCEEHSVGGLSWFPSGADLTRISDSKYDDLLPWLVI